MNLALICTYRGTSYTYACAFVLMQWQELNSKNKKNITTHDKKRSGTVRLTIEVIAVTIEDAIAAEQGGADRIELIDNFTEGGTTPSVGVIHSVKQAVSIPVYTMVRPRGGNFVYSELEIEAMIEDARQAGLAGADGIVVGALRHDNTVDVDTVTRVAHAAKLPITFHRAFDNLPVEIMTDALEEISALPYVERVLTSGGHENPHDGYRVIRDLVQRNVLKIMPGGGIRTDTVQDIVKKTGVSDIHLGTAVRRHNDPLQPVDAQRISHVRAMFS